VISHWHKFITSGQISVQGDVSCNILSGIDTVVSLALAMDGRLK